MKSRFLSCVLILTMLCALIPPVATAAEDPPNGILYEQGFEDGTVPADWIAGASWMVSFDTQNCISGKHSIFSRGGDTLLISPKITLSEASVLTLRARYQNMRGDTVRVLISTTGTDPEDFSLVTTQLLSDHTTLYPFDLSAYSGEVYLAFAQTNKHPDSILVLDDIIVRTAESAAPSVSSVEVVRRTSSGDAVVEFRTASDIPVTYYYAVTEAGAPAPAIDTSGKGATCNLAGQTLTLSGLPSSYDKLDLYLVVKNAFGILSDQTFHITLPPCDLLKVRNVVRTSQTEATVTVAVSEPLEYYSAVGYLPAFDTSVPGISCEPSVQTVHLTGLAFNLSTNVTFAVRTADGLVVREALKIEIPKAPEEKRRLIWFGMSSANGIGWPGASLFVRLSGDHGNFTRGMPSSCGRFKEEYVSAPLGTDVTLSFRAYDPLPGCSLVARWDGPNGKLIGTFTNLQTTSELCTFTATPDTEIPQITPGTAVRISDTTAVVTFTPSEYGYYSYRVVPEGPYDMQNAPAPWSIGQKTECEVQETTITISDLPPEAQDVYLRMYDLSDNLSDWNCKITIPATDPDVPPVSAPPTISPMSTVLSRADACKNVTVTMDLNGKTLTSISPLTQGRDYAVSGNAVTLFASRLEKDKTEDSITQYTFYFSDYSTQKFKLTKITKYPSFASGTCFRLSHDRALVEVVPDSIDPTAYYAVVEAGAPAPAISEMVNGGTTNWPDASRPISISLSGLTPGPKDIYIIAKTSSGAVGKTPLRLSLPAFVPSAAPTRTGNALCYAGEPATGSVSLTAPANTVAIRLGVTDLIASGAKSLKQVRFFPRSGTFTLMIWEGNSPDGSLYNPGEPVYTQTLTNVVPNTWNTVTLDPTFSLSTNKYTLNRDLWVGFQSLDGGEIALDDGTVASEKGDLVLQNGTWRAAAGGNLCIAAVLACNSSLPQSKFTLRCDTGFEDLPVPMILCNGVTLKRVSDLVSGVDYVISGSTLILKKEWLAYAAAKNPPVANSSNSSVSLSLHLSEGDPLSLVISFQMPPITFTPIDALRTSPTTGKIIFTAPIPLLYYYAVVEAGAPAPTVDTSGAGILIGTAPSSLMLTKLTSGAKDVYLIPKLISGTLETAPVKITIPAFRQPTTRAGAQVRTRGKSGLRFLSELSKPLTNVVEYGTILALNDPSLSPATFVLGNKSVFKVPAKRIYAETDEKIQFTVVITDIAPKYYTREYCARAYAILKDGSVMYADTYTIRSVYHVAHAARNDPNGAFNPESRAVLDEIIQSVTG